MIEAEKIRDVVRHGLVLSVVSVLVGTCAGQVRFDSSPGLIRNVLATDHASGSIVYADTCEFVGPRIPVPPHVHLPRKASPAVEMLQDMFSGDSAMVVAQDANGLIRMVEKDVPTDILGVEIHHIVFDAAHAPFPKLFHGPNMALMTILSSPDVLSFEKEHNISPADFRLEGSMGQDLPALSGELNEVTLSQALDYVLKAFPGYWVYENCTTNDGRRAVHFRFYY